jgi:hypothetical protein
MNDRYMLLSLRLSVARLAQLMRVEVSPLPVIDKSVNELIEMTDSDGGWNSLIVEMMDNYKNLEQLQRRFITDNEDYNPLS